MLSCQHSVPLHVIINIDTLTNLWKIENDSKISKTKSKKTTIGK